MKLWFIDRAVVVAEPLKELTQFSWWMPCRQPSDQASQFRLSLIVDCYHAHPHSRTHAHTQHSVVELLVIGSVAQTDSTFSADWMPFVSPKQQHQSTEEKFIGSRPSDHYFRSVCLFVCLSVCLSFCLFVCLCRVFLSRLWSDFDQTRTHVICLGLVVSARI